MCQESFLASIAPSPLATRFVRELKSSKDPEELVQCSFSDPRNEAAWRSCVEQGREEPFMQWLAQLATVEVNMFEMPWPETRAKRRFNRVKCAVSNAEAPAGDDGSFHDL